MFLLLSLLFACEPEEVEPVDCVHEPSLEYDNFGRPFLDAYCNGCHSSLMPEGYRNDAPVDVDFDTYAMVLQWKDRIRVRSQFGIDGAMPPGGGPTEADIDKLNEWIDCAVSRDWEQVYGGGGDE